MLSWGGEGSTVCFAELCIFKSIVIPGISLVLAEEGKALRLQMGYFSRCSAQPEFMSDKSGHFCRSVEVLKRQSLFI